MLAPGRIHNRRDPTLTLSPALAVGPPGELPPRCQDAAQEIQAEIPQEQFLGPFSWENLQDLATQRPSLPRNTTAAET